MPTRTRLLMALPLFLSLTFCSSSSKRDGGDGGDGGSAGDAGGLDAQVTGTDAGPSDGPPGDASPGDALAADASPSDAGLTDGAPTDASTHDAAVPDAGCAPPLANCNGTGLTCEVNTSTSSLHCGACGRSCLGAACNSGYCAPTTGGRGDGLQHIMFQGVAYATDTNALPQSDYFIGRLTNQGKTYDQIASGTGATGGIEADASYFYFAVSGNPSHVYRKAHTAAPAAAPEMLFQTATFAAWMVIRGGTLYWMSGDYLNATIYKRAMNAPPSDTGTQVTTVGEPRVSSFVATSTTLYWMVQTNTANVLRKLSVTGTVAADVPNAPTTPVMSIHADANRVYWGVSGNQAGVYSYYDGGSVVRLSAISARSAYPDLLSDQLYFGDPFTVTPLYRMPKTGGTPVEIATTLFGELAGSDAQFVYGFGGWGSTTPVYRFVK